MLSNYTGRLLWRSYSDFRSEQNFIGCCVNIHRVVLMWFLVIVALGFHLVQFSLSAIMTGCTKAPSFIFSSTNSKKKKKSGQNSRYVNQTEKQELLLVNPVSPQWGLVTLTLLKSCMCRQIFRMQWNWDGYQHIRQGERWVTAKNQLILWDRSV